MRQYDVIVVGGGLAGMFSAITAARRGRKVLLLAKGVGAIAVAGGNIDILGYDAQGCAIRNPQQALSDLAPEHPYSLLGLRSVEEALQSFCSLCAEEGYAYQGSINRNQWIPTALGRLKPSGLVPLSMDGAALKSAAEIVIVGVAGLKDYNPRVIADGLAKYPFLNAPRSIVELETGIQDGRDLTALDVARWLDTPIGRQACIRQLAPHRGESRAFLLPPILGTQPDYEVWNELQTQLGCKVLETVGLPPAVTGYRLRRLLLKVLRKLKVEFVEQTHVVRARCEHGRCLEIVTGNLDRERRYAAQSYVLATGGLFGGGLEAAPGRVQETVFDLPVKVPEQMSDWSHKSLFFSSSQPFAQFGVKVDSSLRPIDSQGRRLLENVFVVGKSLAGYDYCHEKSGNGVALATSYRAGLEA